MPRTMIQVSKTTIVMAGKLHIMGIPKMWGALAIASGEAVK